MELAIDSRKSAGHNRYQKMVNRITILVILFPLSSLLMEIGVEWWWVFLVPFLSLLVALTFVIVGVLSAFLLTAVMRFLFGYEDLLPDAL